jgi:hypothetical protein
VTDAGRQPHVVAVAGSRQAVRGMCLDIELPPVSFTVRASHRPRIVRSAGVPVTPERQSLQAASAPVSDRLRSSRRRATKGRRCRGARSGTKGAWLKHTGTFPITFNHRITGP